jgi:hypothetical protein
MSGHRLESAFENWPAASKSLSIKFFVDAAIFFSRYDFLLQPVESALGISASHFQTTGVELSDRSACRVRSGAVYWMKTVGGGGRTRTYEGVSQRIYSLNSARRRSLCADMAFALWLQKSLDNKRN